MKTLRTNIKHVLMSLLATLDALIFAVSVKTGLIMGLVTLPNGSIFAIASGYSAAKNMTALSNANPAVAVLEASHGVATGDFIELQTGWSRLTDKIVRAGTVSTNNVPLDGVNATATNIYPAGSGVGSVRKISGFTQLQQVLTTSSEGGEQQFTTYQFLESDREKRIPTNKSAGGLTMTIADDPLLAGYQVAAAANEDRLQRAIRVTLPNGSILIYNAYVTLNETPSLTVNEIMAVQVTLSFLASPTRYSA